MTTRELMRLREITAKIGLSKASIYRMMARGEFPRPIKLSPNRVAWHSNDIIEWINKRPTSTGMNAASILEGSENG